MIEEMVESRAVSHIVARCIIWCFDSRVSTSVAFAR